MTVDDPEERAARHKDGEAAQPILVRTITDLARLAGVTPGTVSRALANNSLVNIKTRERIQALAQEHDFRLNQMASKLRRKQTGIIGVVIPLGHERSQHISDPFFTNLLGHLADALTEHGFDLMLRKVIPREDEDWLGQLIGTGIVEGVLLIGQSDQFDQIERVAKNYRPMVAWGNYRPGQAHCVVGVDNKLGGFLAVEHLMKCGARRIAYLGDSNAVEFAARYEGALDAAQQDRLSLCHLPTHLSPDRMRDEVAAHFDQHLVAIDGIFAATDQIAAEALRQLRQRGVLVPEQVQLVGFDDLPIAEQTYPSLTTIRQDIEFGGYKMVELLIKKLKGKEAKSIVMPPKLVVRNSTKMR